MRKSPAAPGAAEAAGVRSAPFSEITWMLALFGTAIGAGILYLPLQAGTGSLWALILLSALIFPLLYLAHRRVLDMLMLGNGELDYSGVAGRYLGRGLDWIILLLFLLTFQAVLVSYAIGLNANLGDYLHQQGWTATDWSQKPFLSLGILLAFALIYLIGQQTLLRLMTLASGLLIVALFGLSLYLIPFWDLSPFSLAISPLALIADMLLVLPILTFSLIFFPAMSSMVMALKQSHPLWPEGAETRLKRVVLVTSALLMLFVIFFVISCVLALTPPELASAMASNLNGLSMLSGKPGISPVLAEIGTLLGLCALFTSFVGVFLAVRDAVRELIRRLLPSQSTTASAAHRWTEWLLLTLVLGSAWLMTIANPSIVKTFGKLISPLVGIFIFLLPLAVLARARGPGLLLRPGSLFVLLFGVLILFSYDLGNWLKGALQ
ncbi:aromatic amino acid transport family protein [Thiorhodovibrio frisius]|uniref:Amino acid permease n=1 Tax=Thiorhodovibrio frisius TaxID=631362 RepID=H8Z4Y1_9GAMM|nr:aromatic amino acid transport family protein [Thiorhodovibrio frisius]EIC20388.1 amino acid permease [Thiorhodovibrio frisius]WPL21130.1 Serine transporter [Thiorhodovibrio frisius]